MLEELNVFLSEVVPQLDAPYSDGRIVHAMAS